MRNGSGGSGVPEGVRNLARWTVRIGSVLLLASLALVILSPALAEKLLFFPGFGEPGPAPTLADVAGEDVIFPTSDDVLLHAWWFDAGEGTPTVILFHGNAGHVGGRVPLARGMLERGVSVLMPDYRGYGRSEGSPSEKGIYRDGRAAVEFLKERRGSSSSAPAVWGRSLGATVALKLAADDDPDVDRVVVESGFTTLREIAGVAYPFVPSFLLHRLEGRYDNLERIRRVGDPVLVIHGTDDDLIPPEMGRELYEAAPEPKSWYAVEGGGHNDLNVVGGADYFDRIAEFVAGGG